MTAETTRRTSRVADADSTDAVRFPESPLGGHLHVDCHWLVRRGGKLEDQVSPFGTTPIKNPMSEI